jgi:hypothetical protein
MVQHGPVGIEQVHPDRVQHLLPVAARPPQVGIGDIDRQRGRFGADDVGRPGDRGPCRVQHLQPVGRGLRGRIGGFPVGVFDLRQDPDRADRAVGGVGPAGGRRARVMGMTGPRVVGRCRERDRDLRVQLVQPRAGPGLQPDRPRDPAGHEHGTPVPAHVAAHLPDRVVGQGVAHVRQVSQDLLVLPCDPQRGVEEDLQGVLALLEGGLHVEPPGSVLVLGPRDLVVVDQDRRCRVERGRHQVHPVLREQCRADRERPAVGQIALARPRDVLLPRVDVRVLDHARVQQVRQERPGHGRGHIGHRERDRTVRHRQGPQSTQVHAGDGVLAGGDRRRGRRAAGVVGAGSGDGGGRGGDHGNLLVDDRCARVPSVGASGPAVSGRPGRAPTGS